MAAMKSKRKERATPLGTESASSPRVGERLETYRARRRFGVTPEPAPSDGSSQAAGHGGKKGGKKAPAALAFVVQKHDARRLHYDVRLEVDGAMVSWAVPKGPSYDPRVRRLAVQTEDHPMEYNAFEGRIPDGEYGAGDVLLWDRGTYETVPPGQGRAMLDKGHMHVRLSGRKLVGEWHIVRTGGRSSDGETPKQPQWLLFKARDPYANPAYDVVTARPESIVSGHQATRGPRRVGASSSGTSARALHETVGEPQLATAVARIDDPSQWIFEIKYDGYRILACKAGDDARLYTRHGHDWTDKFGPIGAALGRLPARECVVDGEACAVDARGHASFGALQEWLGGQREEARIAFAAFDLLWLDGRDLRREPIEVRRELLEKLLAGQGPPLTYSRSVAGNVEGLLRAAKEAGLEGLMAKRKGSTYHAGRSHTWLKLRFERRQDAVIAGWLPLASTTDVVGALLLAVAVEGKLTYAGRVGTGFDDRTRRALARRLAPLAVRTSMVDTWPATKGAHWVRPELVCECGFKEWTRDGSMRHPRFLGMREDKAPMECVREGQSVGDGGDVEVGERAHAGAHGQEHGHANAHAHERPAPRGTPKLANPHKILFPRDGYTKQDIWDYYTAIAPVMIPHIAGRPLTMQRYPDGIDGEEWYQQNVPLKPPAFVRLVDTGPRHEGKKRIVCDDVETLQWLANLAALTLHQWCAHVPPTATTRAAIDLAMAQPDYVVLDLDPGDGPWSHLVEVAHAVKALLDALHLKGFPKTSGKRGVHVVVPIDPGPTHEQATGFAEQVARAVAKVLPKIATVERMKERRGGKLYVDYGQNGEGRTVVCPYTIRARDGAVVSMPIAWDELTDDLDPTEFTIRSAPSRVAERGDLLAAALTTKQKLPV
jgi:bifunctional non-homologous end joining protein LigD